MPEHVLLNVLHEAVAVHTFLHADHHAEAVNPQSPIPLQTEDGGIGRLIVVVLDVGEHAIYLRRVPCSTSDGPSAGSSSPLVYTVLSLALAVPYSRRAIPADT